MGLFDTIEVNKPCLKCEKNIETLQTKATSCTMEYYEMGDKIIFNGIDVVEACIEIHGICESCRYWHDGVAVIKNNKLVDVTDLKLGEKIY